MPIATTALRYFGGNNAIGILSYCYGDSLLIVLSRFLKAGNRTGISVWMMSQTMSSSMPR